MAALRFEIPEEPLVARNVVTALIDAVPDTWSWLDGGLRAPQSLIDSGDVAIDSGYRVSRFSKVTMIGKSEQQQSSHGPVETIQVAQPSYFRLIADRALPERIAFDEAGFELARPTLVECRQIASAYVRRGYEGCLLFYSGCHDNCKYDNPAKMSLEFDRKAHHVDIITETRFGGKMDDINPFLVVCTLFSLSSEPIRH